MELLKANRQWSQRPPDERFRSLDELYRVTKAYAEQAAEKDVPFASLRVEARSDDVELVGRANVPAKLTHWAFGQLCQRVGAPASYLRELPATLACQNLNHGLAQQVGEPVARLMFHNNGGLLLRAFTSDRYARIWNHEVAERLVGLVAQGWEPAVPDTSFGVVGTPTPEQVESPALYASDHDMFAFIRNRAAIVQESGNGDGLQRGVIVENSEVGASALKLTRFLYRVMCGNHIIWGASDMTEISIRHVGNARRRWNVYAAAIKQYADESASEEEARIASAKYKLIAATKEEVLDALFGKRSVGLSRKTLEAGYDAVVPDQDGDPNSVWGFAQGLTRYSQTVPYADERTVIDRAAGRILAAF